MGRQNSNTGGFPPLGERARAAARGLALGFDGTIDIDRVRAQRWLTVLCVSLLVRLVVTWLAIDLFPHHIVNDDKGVYLTQAAMLLEGRLFLYPGRLAETARSWFFVVREAPSAPGDVQLYSEYSSAVPTLSVIGPMVGLPSLVLGAIATISATLVYALVADASDRTTGVVAAGLLDPSSLFPLTSSAFLTYMPTMMLNLESAVCYVRTARRDSSGYAVVAGAPVGAAFFVRPHTAVLFALSFIARSLWALATARRAGTGWVTSRRYAAIALPDLAFVGPTLAYNTVMTGDPLALPYTAFTPRDGIGFEERAILGHKVVYTPAMDVETVTEALDLPVTQWGPMGWFGTTATVISLGVTARHWRGHEASRDPRGSARRHHHGLGGRDRAFTGFSGDVLAYVIVDVFASVFVDNAAFWGTHNDPRDGLIDLLGPFYHSDALVLLAASGTAGVVAGARLFRRLTHRRSSAPEARGIIFSVSPVSTLFAGGVMVGAVEDPYDESRL